MARIDLANFVNALFWVYYVLIFARVLFSWIRVPSGPMLTIYRFIYDLTEPYLRIFRRFIPVVSGIDFSPFIGLIILVIVRSYLVGLIAYGTF